ncbi:MAG: aldehyde dehydrogenase family protein, partial [Chloroflexi bacterium]|nr:aldehyde dehydrogenase family protein [Chloroflexota bacterium]
DEAVQGILFSAFEHANQKCSACSRVFVHRLVFPRLRERLVRATKSLPVGSAADPGTLVDPLIESEARERVLAYAQKARKEGEVLVDRLDVGSANPQQVGPLVVELKLANLSRSVIAQEEIFGPILALIPFEDEAEMLEQVNGTEYALTAGVFSRSPVTVARMVRVIRAGNIYVNRKITGARVGIEPFGGFQLSGTGPKAGSPEYLFAFVRRRSEGLISNVTFSSLSQKGDESPSVTSEDGFPRLAEKVALWPAGVRQRRDVLRRCIGLLRGRSRSTLLGAITSSYPVSPSEAERIADDMAVVATAVLSAYGEIAEPEATLPVPGQRNYTSWETPRGRGFAIAGDDTPASRLAGMLFGPLLAGNGLTVAVASVLQPLAGALVRYLRQSGVPDTVIVMAPQGSAEAGVSLADAMFHFAVTDLGLAETQRVYERLGVAHVAEGQRWVKALINMRDGPQPGEPGFLRLFALPKTIAIRTLRHGVDLELPLLYLGY